MGVTGLLPALKSIQEASHLEKYRGKTLAIDTYAWLHKAIYGCAMEIVLEKPTRAYLNYMNRRLDMLTHYGITPYMVLDGDYLPTKANTEKEREERRREYKRLGLEALRANRRSEAYNYFNKACDITPQIAKSVIEALKSRNIQYVVAPYEADAQMVYLEKHGLVQGIISEDSDLLIFGCQRLITKLDDSGSCIEVRRDKFKDCRESAIGLFSNEQLKLMAIVSGCDYTKGIPNVGMQRAINLVNRYSTIGRLLQAVRYEGKLKVPVEFETEYYRAITAFNHQVVFDPRTQKPVHLNPLSPEDDMLEVERCAGKIHDDELHRKIAIGELDPITKLPLSGREASSAPPSIARRAPITTKTQPRTIDALLQVKSKPVVRSASEPTARKSAIRTIDHFMSVQTSNVKRRKLLFGSQDSASETSTYFTRSTASTFTEDTRSVFSEQNSSDYNITDPDEDEEPVFKASVTQKQSIRMPLRDMTNQVSQKLEAKNVAGRILDRNSLSSFKYNGK
ncbi:hypothetical protein KL928_003935 [Ogataea angusta]|uniref:Exonuclease 1 n=1 Tax=Pichia angusta TaxID=870730 RepID=A0AAN6I4S4_PICAN|nr:uncharacterized protein KL928_003935 [Ogataea angusta]KAG7817200.1 hypothetical protein KL928_003935 [Ogataea angusta]